ncbi:MAG: response regulator [Bacteroidetes bacterium]|mgnify:FL=1|jgi:two-component system, cell cycle response regulator DivK|nr:response regulator [Bacteroidota bacterium]MBT3748907.1 response regulator [Bacteroidota bacterium]MBT4399477.1 response regulator [Bacteroidota bacterium]MBT4408562.1 response regulator [Bacteroidota bacterium]MBT5426731.1 response regulator [Bacteroidota bacterium]
MQLNKKTRAEDLDWNDKTILVVEDVETNLLFIQAAISKTGINIIWAKDGMEAIEKVQTEPSINIVLMDLRMPKLDGFKATEVIKNIRNELPVIAQTTYTEDYDKDRVFDAGCDAYLAKPIRLDALLETLQKFI